VATDRLGGRRPVNVADADPALARPTGTALAKTGLTWHGVASLRLGGRRPVNVADADPAQP